MFWSDVWNDNLLQHKFPRLYSYAKNKKISVAQFLTQNQVQDQFHLPISAQAFQEYEQLQLIIQQLQVSSETKDSWEYIGGGGALLYPLKVLSPPIQEHKPPKLFHMDLGLQVFKQTESILLAADDG
jgi:hypothetical protein